MIKRKPRIDVDAVNPTHYKRLDPEPIVVIENWNLRFCPGNAIKYIGRAGNKEGATAIEDLKKARWYLDREIAWLEGQS